MDKDIKLLIWTDAFLLHYCLAYLLQNEEIFKIYGIFDVPNKLKSFFETQKIVDYKKKWFFHDHISWNKNPDMKYLQKFENDYDLKLWTLAINERLFFKYNPFHKFEKNEILSILESECRLFEGIIDSINPDYLITLDPGFHHGHLLTQICKKKSIPILMLNISKFPNQCYISQSIHSIDTEIDENDNQNFSFKEIQNLLTKNNLSQKLEHVFSKTRQSKVSRIQAGLNVFLHENSNINSHFSYYGRTKRKLFFNELKNSKNTIKRKKFLDKNSYKKIFDEKYIYLPLNQEPERSLLIDAPYYTNQIETIHHIAKSIPIDYILYVKEHPTQGKARGWRSISDYKKIIELPNVKLIHPELPSIDLIKKSSLVITVGGTASFESQIYGKPSLMFTSLGYQKMSNIQKIDSLEKLPEQIKLSLNSKVDLKKLSAYVSLLLKNSFDFDYFGFQIRSGNVFFYNENLVDVKIDENKMINFLKTEKTNLDILSREHIKKIEFYEKN